MKKLLIFTLFAFAFFVACKQEKKSAGTEAAEQTLELTTSSYERILRYNVPMDEDTLTYYCMGTLRLVLPTTIAGEEPTELRHAMMQTFFCDSVSTTLPEAIERFLSEPLGMEDGTYTNLTVVDSANTDYMQLSDHSIDIHVKTLTTRWLVLESEAYEYFAGAAHPMNGSFYLNYDLKQGYMLTLDDIVNDRDHLAVLLSRLYSEQRSDGRPYGYATTLSQTGGFDIPVTDNFYLTSEGLAFVYQPYEIASYAEGVQTIRVSFYELLDAGILTKQFQEVDF